MCRMCVTVRVLWRCACCAVSFGLACTWCTCVHSYGRRIAWNTRVRCGERVVCDDVWCVSEHRWCVASGAWRVADRMKCGDRWHWMTPDLLLRREPSRFPWALDGVIDLQTMTLSSVAERANRGGACHPALFPVNFDWASTVKNVSP